MPPAEPQRNNDAEAPTPPPQAAAAPRPSRGAGKAARRAAVTLCTVDTRYPVVTDAARACGFSLVPTDDDKCNVYWVDTSAIAERLARLEPWQRINHFPGMSQISRKNRLAHNLGTMRRKFPKEFAFYPKTWVLPHEDQAFRAQFGPEGQAPKGTTFIVKPENSSKGRGIFLVKSLAGLALTEPQVAQVYIPRPLLLDGFKFDIRMYALVTSCAPLRVYKYGDGLVRLCTAEYTRPSVVNLDDRFMHLTNAAINRFSENYVVGSGGGTSGETEAEETGSKRSLQWFLGWVRRQYGGAAADRLWQQMGELCVKTVVSVLPTLVHHYKAVFGEDRTSSRSRAPDLVHGSRAFEVLGFDILVDQALKPWLIEVNTLPSFATESAVDRDVKHGLIEQTLRIVQAKPTDQQAFQRRRKTESAARLHRHKQRADLLTAALSDEANVVVQTRRRIEALFRQNAPDRMDMVDKLMSKNKGREASLLGRLLRHFNATGSRPSSVPVQRDDKVDAEVKEEEAEPLVPQEQKEQEDVEKEDIDGDSDEEDDDEEAEPCHDAEEEGDTLKGFERIYPVPAGSVDIYAPLVVYVWEKERKLLCGNRQPPSLRPHSAQSALQRRKLLAFMSSSSGTADARPEGGDEAPGETTGDNKQEDNDAMAALDLLNKRTTSSRRGCSTTTEEDGKLNALLLNLVTDGASLRRRKPSTALSCGGSVASPSSSLAQQKAVAARLMRGCSSSSGSSKEDRPTSPAAAQRRPPSARRPPGAPRPGYQVLTPKVVDLAGLVNF